MGLKKRLKEEVHFIKLGAKVLPKVVGQKAKGWVKTQYETAKQRAIMERQIEAEAKKAEEEAYKEERIKIARQQAQERARKKASGKGILAQLGEAGERMSLSDLLSVPESKKGSQEMGSPSDFMFSGLGQQKKKQQGKELHIYHHYPKKKKRRH